MATAALALGEIPSVLEAIGGVIVVTGVLIGALNRKTRFRKGDTAVVVPEPAPLVGAGDQR
jgi:drug/metabolite transporter (DMT)-like permease